MTSILLATLVLITQNGSRPHDFLRTHQVWVSRIEWKKAPSNYNRKLSSGVGTVLFFGPNQEFGMLNCVLNREPHALTISRGDGVNVHKGNWEILDGALLVKYRLVSIAVEQVQGEKLPGPLKTMRPKLGASNKWKGKVRAIPRLVFDGEEFKPAARLKHDEVLLFLRASHPMRRGEVASGV